jgi:hypothetical protein
MIRIVVVFAGFIFHVIAGILCLFIYEIASLSVLNPSTSARVSNGAYFALILLPFSGLLGAIHGAILAFAGQCLYGYRIFGLLSLCAISIGVFAYLASLDGICGFLQIIESEYIAFIVVCFLPLISVLVLTFHRVFQVMRSGVDNSKRCPEEQTIDTGDDSPREP